MEALSQGMAIGVSVANSPLLRLPQNNQVWQQSSVAQLNRKSRRGAGQIVAFRNALVPLSCYFGRKIRSWPVASILPDRWMEGDILHSRVGN